MNDYFRTVYTHEPSLDQRLDQKTVSISQLITVDFNQDGVLKKSSPSDTKNQHDELHFRIALYIPVSFTTTFSLSRNQRELPTEWKDETVTPI